ncbi:hypothetical protein H5T87_03065 [bacterium]|nr:hypothetical protein [bacterium]
MRLQLFLLVLLLVPLLLAQYERPKKKLIEYGWDVPYTDFVRRHIGDMEKRPFDGIVLRFKGGWKASPAHIFRKSVADPKEYEEDLKNLKATKFTRFTDNFVLVWGTREKDWDWFNENDWKATEKNIRLIASVAKAGGLVGICFDPEPYDGNPWHYPSLLNAKTKSFEDYWKRVRECGARFIRALQSEFPNIRILTFFQTSIFPDIVDIADPAKRMESLSQHGYGLLPAFLNGMLDAANSQVIIIDGNEPAYYYRDPDDYFRAYHLMRQRGLSLIAPENRKKYTLQVQAGFALYLDYYFGLIPKEYEWGRLSHFLAPDERTRWCEHNVYYALYTTDEYVWCYSERMDWWGTQKGSDWYGLIPQGAEEAIRSARNKIDKGEPLGFGIKDVIEAGQTRMHAGQ